MNSAAVIGPRERIEERSRGRRDIFVGIRGSGAGLGLRYSGFV
jgi:hypothetical protein